MQVLVESKKLTVTAALRAFVQKHAQKLATLGIRVRQVRVFLENVARKTGEAHRSGVTIRVEMPGKDVVVERKDHDLYTAIVAATERVKFQLSKLKLRQLERDRGKSRDTSG
jgi:ribosomal subunit interface protein